MLPNPHVHYSNLGTKEDRKNALVKRMNANLVAPQSVEAAEKTRIITCVASDALSGAEDLTGEGSFVSFAQKNAVFSGRDINDVKEEFVTRLEILAQNNPDDSDKYFKGKSLRRADGKASGHRIVLTALGKNQLLGWGDDAVSIAWRDFIFQAYQVAKSEMDEMKQYIKEKRQVREQNKKEFGSAKEYLIARGETEWSAEGKVRVADKQLYQPMTPGFSSAAEAICAVKGVQPTAQNKKSIIRKTIVANGTVSFQWEHGRLRNRSRVMAQTTGVDYYQAAKIVSAQAKQTGECLYRDQNNAPYNDLTQARINFSAEFDYAAFASPPAIA